MKLAEAIRMTPEEKIEWARKRRKVIDAARDLVREVRRCPGGEGGINWFVQIGKLMEAVDRLDGKAQ